MRTLGSLTAVVLTAAVCTSQAAAQDTLYRGIPPGYDFPANAETLERYRATQDVAALRLHAWNVWAGMNQMTSDGTAFWETWYRSSETFRTGPVPQAARRLVREFQPPRQHQPPPGAAPQAAGASLLSFVLFNEEAHEHIRAEGLFSKAKLDEINGTFPVDTPWRDRKISDFPPEAISLKVVWWPVAKDRATPMPIWDFEPTRPISQSGGNDFPNWKRVVAVDATRPHIGPDETTTISFNGTTHTDAHVVGLDQFYHFELDPVTANAANRTVDGQAVRLAIGRDLVEGDYIVLAQVHVTTKEINDWVWATFWWHDRPNEGPYATFRPNAVTGFWRNYLMDVAYDVKTPREADGTPDAVYNPWLEARFPNGVLSNCMTCHQRASHPPISFLPVTRGDPDPADPAFQPGRLQTDFLWSVVYESQ